MRAPAKPTEMRKDRDPRVITLKYDATCAETGKALKKGEQAVYYHTSPKGKNLFHPDSEQARAYRDMMADQANGYDY